MSTILTTIRWLSIFTGALSLFYLGHAWFEFGLGEVFTRIYAWYAGILHPVVELLKPVAVWLVALLGWSLPVWWKDSLALYLAIGGATGRSRSYSWLYWDNDYEADRDRVRSAPVSQQEENEWLDDIAKKESEAKRISQFALLTTPLRMMFWPVYWASDLCAMGIDYWKFPRSFSVSSRLRHGYVGVSVREFTKILAGALIFAALNAGLG